MNNKSIIPVFIPHLGCPHNCVFCDQKHIAGKVTAPTPEQVYAQVEEALKKEHKVPPQVAFYGGSFTAIPEEEQNGYLNAVKKWIEDGSVSGVRISTRPDFIDEGILKRLISMGVSTVELGVQSFDDEVLKASGRGHTALQAEVAAKCVKSMGLELVLQLMAGLPKDTRERAVNSACKAAELDPDGARIYPVAVIEDTALAHMYRSGKYSPLTVDDAVEWSADMLEVFIKSGIPVIRIGLNPSESLEEAVLAGAYHPALGELVRSRVYLRIARREIEKIPSVKKADLTLEAGKRYISALCGQKGVNKKCLTEEFELSALHFKQAELEEWKVNAVLNEN